MNSMAPNIDVYIIPDMKNRKAAGKYGHREGRRKAENAGMQALWEFGLINIILVLTTIAAWILQKFHLPESNIIMVYILGVLLSSYISDKKSMRFIRPCSVCLPLIFYLQNRTFL